MKIWWEESTRSSPWRYWMAGAWFWQDDDCAEPMGPFESRAEAVADYRALRPVSSAHPSASQE